MRQMKCESYLSGLFLLTCAAAFAAPGEELANGPNPALRLEFRAALARAETTAADESDSAALRAYVIYPYLSARRLQTALRVAPGDATDARVQIFLHQQASLPLIRDLRGDWLMNLAARGEWARYLAHYDSEDSDPALRCHEFQAWIITGGYEGLKDELRQFWLTGRQMPQACVAPFEWLKNVGVLTPELHEQRARLALAAGNPSLAEWLIRAAPPERQAALQQWLRLVRDPQAGLRALAAQPALPEEWLAVRGAFIKLARADATLAAPLLPPLLPRAPDAAARDELLGELALGYALNRSPLALEAFRQLPDSALNERLIEWRIRAALWAGDWQQAADWLHRLPENLATESRWIYWSARALETLGRNRQSTPILQTLAAENGIYGVLSAWRLGRGHQPQSLPAPEDASLRARLELQPEIVRARELFAVGRADWAGLEWRRATLKLSAPEMIEAARIAGSWGWHAQGVPLLRQAQIADDLGLLYPDPFAQPIAQAAEQSGVPAVWITSVMRQESLFLPGAVSKSDALGLLQLLLPTARQVAKRLQRPLPARADLFDPVINIPLGTAYLREMTSKFDGRFIFTLAAYNAGPNTVPRWLPEQAVDADVWIENIPFNETRDYIQKILWNITVYGWRNNGGPQDLRALLLPVKMPVAP